MPTKTTSFIKIYITQVLCYVPFTSTQPYDGMSVFNSNHIAATTLLLMSSLCCCWLRLFIKQRNAQHTINQLLVRLTSGPSCGIDSRCNRCCVNARNKLLPSQPGIYGNTLKPYEHCFTHSEVASVIKGYLNPKKYII